MSIPCGFATPADPKHAAGVANPADSGNPLPVGLQLIGPHLSEPTLLNIAHTYQQTTDWHRQRPPI